VTTVPNWLAVIGFVVPAGTGLIGYVLAGRNEQARDERAAKREATARRASVRERLEEERHAFQRETLLELQDALQRQVRSVAKIILHDRRTLREHGTLTQVGPELSGEGYEIGVTTRRLQERVLDSALRGAVGEFRSHVADVETAFIAVREMSAEGGVQHLDGLQREVAEHYIALSDQVGTALRIDLGWLPEETRPGQVVFG
jgi:hypothetical protein